MADDVDNTPEETAESPGPLAGERLAQARQEQQISVLEIAKELHLDEAKVRALERNEFDVLGAPVFAKGHLRKYAELVNVPLDDIFVDYYKLTRSAEMPPVIATRTRPRHELSPGPWIAVIVVIVMAASAYWWFTRPATVEPAPDEPAVSEPEAEPQEAAPEASLPVGEEAPDAVSSPADEQRPEVEPQADAAVGAPEPQAQPAVIEETESPEVAAGQMRLLLTYSGDCWTEVTDATGRRLFFALGTDGRTVELSGAEPFNVLIGSPGSVAVQVNGEDYALPAGTRPDRPLRLTIAGS
jgi:cytoskeleton protein RodZ